MVKKRDKIIFFISFGFMNGLLLYNICTSNYQYDYSYPLGNCLLFPLICNLPYLFKKNAQKQVFFFADAICGGMLYIFGLLYLYKIGQNHTISNSLIVVFVMTIIVLIYFIIELIKQLKKYSITNKNK